MAWRTEEPIPAARARLETDLILALGAGPDAITSALHTFRWDEHRELACFGLAEVARRSSPATAAAVALKTSAFCDRARGPYCARCPVRAARRAA